jgi:hypothetical protein
MSDDLKVPPDNAEVIICQQIDQVGYIKPGGVIIPCMTCLQPMCAWEESAKMRASGVYLICRECFAKFVPIWNKRGEQIKFAGRIMSNRPIGEFNGPS